MSDTETKAKEAVLKLLGSMDFNHSAVPAGMKEKIALESILTHKVSKKYLFLDFKNHQLDFLHINGYLDVAFSQMNRVLIIHNGDDKHIEAHLPTRFLNSLQQKNMHLLLLNYDTLMQIHNLYFICSDTLKQSIIDDLFFSSLHVVSSTKTNEIRKRIMERLIDERIDQLVGISEDEKRLMDILENEKYKPAKAISYQKIAAAIEAIQPLTYQIMKLAHSAQNYVRGMSIYEASYAIGLKEIEKLLITIRFGNLARLFLETGFHAYGTRIDEYYSHSVITGLFLRDICIDQDIVVQYRDRSGLVRSENNFYVLGFLHDFGMAVLDQILYSFYRYEICNSNNHLLLDEEETKFCFSHASIGADSLLKANLPECFSRIILYHHSPEDYYSDEGEVNTKKICYLLFISEYFFSSLLYVKGNDSFEPEKDSAIKGRIDEATAFLGMSLAELARYIYKAIEEYERIDSRAASQAV
jgi:hypothetical protein